MGSADFEIGKTYKTLNTGKGLKPVADVAPIINKGDVKACNSVIHAIDMVLVPDFILSDPSSTTTTSQTSNSNPSGSSFDASYTSASLGNGGLSFGNAGFSFSG